jgi:hypothetical protein
VFGVSVVGLFKLLGLNGEDGVIRKGVVVESTAAFASRVQH